MTIHVNRQRNGLYMYAVNNILGQCGYLTYQEAWQAAYRTIRVLRKKTRTVPSVGPWA